MTKYKRQYDSQPWTVSCFIFIFVYGRVRKERCDLSCVYANKPCRNYQNVYWKIARCRHYFKYKAKFPTTLRRWKKTKKWG